MLTVSHSLPDNYQIIRANNISLWDKLMAIISQKKNFKSSLKVPVGQVLKISSQRNEYKCFQNVNMRAVTCITKSGS